MERLEPLSGQPGPPPINQPTSVSGFVLKEIDVPTAVALLESFYDEDENEQCETWNDLRRTLEEERP